MYIAFIGEEEVSEKKVTELIQETGASTVVLVPSGQVEEVSYSKAKELGLKFDYTAYSTGSYIGRVKSLMQVISKEKGILFIAERKNNLTSKLELILSEADKKGVNYQFI